MFQTHRIQCQEMQRFRGRTSADNVCGVLDLLSQSKRSAARHAVVEMGRTDASLRCATLAGVPHAIHKACWDERAVQGKASHRSFAWMAALVDAVSTTAGRPRGRTCRSQARRADCEKPDPTGMISSTFQPWPILSSSGPPLTCHVPDLFSRASEFLHSYCVRWGLGGSHGVAPA